MHLLDPPELGGRTAGTISLATRIGYGPTMLLTAVWLLCAPPAQGAQLLIESRVPVEVLVDRLPVARLYGSGSATVEVSAGEHSIQVYRGASPEERITHFPEEGVVWLRIGPTSTTVSGTDAPALAASLATPILELRVPAGPGAVAIVGEQRHLLVPDQPLVLTGLGVGATPFEARSVDGSLIWARGELALIAGDHVVLVLPEGRPIEVFGRVEAWVPGS